MSRFHSDIIFEWPQSGSYLFDFITIWANKCKTDRSDFYNKPLSLLKSDSHLPKKIVIFAWLKAF